MTAHWPHHFFLATLAVNLVGCLLIGYLYGLFLLRPEVPVEIRSGLMVGFLGGLTTFSSFSLDTLRLLESGQRSTWHTDRPLVVIEHGVPEPVPPGVQVSPEQVRQRWREVSEP